MHGKEIVLNFLLSTLQITTLGTNKDSKLVDFLPVVMYIHAKLVH